MPLTEKIEHTLRVSEKDELGADAVTVWWDHQCYESCALTGYSNNTSVDVTVTKKMAADLIIALSKFIESPDLTARPPKKK